MQNSHDSGLTRAQITRNDHMNSFDSKLLKNLGQVVTYAVPEGASAAEDVATAMGRVSSYKPSYSFKTVVQGDGVAVVAMPQIQDSTRRGAYHA